MIIEYLKKLEENPRVAIKWPNEGLAVSEIESLEVKYNSGKPFPKAYREFLFLAGKYSYIEMAQLEHDYMQETAREALIEYGFDLGRPFYVTDLRDVGEYFGLIFLDEEEDDPIIYNCRPAYVEDGYKLLEPRPQGKFSNYIDVCVERQKGLEP